MLLARHRSLGRLPATIVIAALAVVVVALAHVLIDVARCPPVLLVPDAAAVARAAPARADAAYLEAFVRGFLEDWASWTPYTVRARRARALGRLAPQALAALAPATERCAPLLESLQQSQSLRIDALASTDLGGGRLDVRVRGSLATYFGGVGGAPDPVEGEVLLETVRATADQPRCLAVTGVRLTKVASCAGARASRAGACADRAADRAAAVATSDDPCAAFSWIENAAQATAVAAAQPLARARAAPARSDRLAATPTGGP